MKIPFNIPPVIGTEQSFIEDAIGRRKLCGDNFYTKECSKLIEEKYCKCFCAARSKNCVC